MKQLQKHIVLLVGLIVISATLAFWNFPINGNANIEKDIFVLADTSEVQKIVIAKSGYTIDISRNQEEWALNDTLKADPSLIQIFNVIMSKVQVIRPVSPINFEEVKQDIIHKGQKITVETSSGQLQFYCGGNAGKTQAYFANAELTKIYLVAIPGYNNYLSGIFELSINQWRDRILFASSWRTIRKLSIDYPGSTDQNLEVYFDSKFMKVKGIDQMDTTLLMTYLAQYEKFQVNDYLNTGQFPRYDSLSNTRPLAELTLLDIDKSKNKKILIYPKMADQKFYLFKDSQNQMIVIDQKRVKSLLKTPDFFGFNSSIE